MKYLLLLLLAGCATPTEKLFEQNAAVCPVRCPLGWTGLVQVEPKMIICVCKPDGESYQMKLPGGDR
jgi:hypothetical protein